MTEQSPEQETPDPVVGDAPPRANVLLSNKAYDVAKQAALYWLPAVAVFYVTVAGYWGWDNATAVSGTIMAADLLLGAVLGVSSKQYQNSDARFGGQIIVQPNENGVTSDLNVSLDPAALHDAVNGKKELTVKVDRP